MHRGRRVVAWIPFGREATVSILAKYLLLDPVIDELWLCMNTDDSQATDRDFAYALADEHEKVVIKQRPGPDTPELDMPPEWRQGYRQPKQMNTGRFPIYMQDRDTVYLRFDDDIIWMHPQTPRTLVDRVIDRGDDVLGVFALIYNNAISSYMLQKHGRIPTEWGIVGRGVRDSSQVSAVDPVGWEDPQFAIRLHEHVLEAIEFDRDDDLLLPAELTLGYRQQFSVSCFGISGNHYADLNGVLEWDEEEHWLTMHHTGIIDRPNIVCGMAPVAHYTFFTQRDVIVQTNILERYRDVIDRRWRAETIGRQYYDRLAESGA